VGAKRFKARTPSRALAVEQILVGIFLPTPGRKHPACPDMRHFAALVPALGTPRISKRSR
jgi:hypothetical protein